jgi:hypothetical protein
MLDMHSQLTLQTISAMRTEAELARPRPSRPKRPRRPRAPLSLSRFARRRSGVATA